MLKIALRLVNKKSRKVVGLLSKTDGIKIACIIGRDDHMWGEYDDELNTPIISPYKALDLVEGGQLDRIIILPYSGAMLAREVLNEMIKLGIPEKILLMPAVPDLEEKEVFTTAEIQNWTVVENKTLYRLQFHIADHCNLNCVSCSHFSSLVDGERFVSVEEVRRDLMSLKRLVKHIDRIDILGGEPFLNPCWKDYIALARELFKYADLTIITNGTYVKALKDSDWKFINENDVCFRMSVYRPFWKNVDEITMMLKEKKVRFMADLGIGAFTDFATILKKEPDNDCKKNREECDADCNQIWHGKLAPCNQMMYIEYFNKYFGTDLPEGVPIEDIGAVDSFDEMNRLLMKPMPLCNYCNTRRCSVQKHQKWERMCPGGKESNSIDKWFC